jgi:hypothetical protein
MLKFKKWTGKNGQVRIYVNGLKYGIRAYVVDGGTTGNYPDGHPEIVVRSDDGYLSQSEIDRLMNEIDDFVEQHRQQPEPWRAPKFNDYLALAQ